MSKNFFPFFYPLYFVGNQPNRRKHGYCVFRPCMISKSSFLMLAIFIQLIAMVAQLAG